MTGDSIGGERLRHVWVVAHRRVLGWPDRGAHLVEYMLVVVLIAILALVALQFAGDQNSELWSEVGSALN